MLRLVSLALLILLAATYPLLAQTVTAGPDSAVVSSPAPTKKQLSAADSAARTERLFRIYIKPAVVNGKSYPAIDWGLRVTRPTKAAVLAALLPGAGQLYNRRYWKLPLVYGLLGGLGYGVYFQQQLYREYVDASDFLLTQPAGTSPAVLDKNRFPRASQERSADIVTRIISPARRYRDQFILFGAAGYGLQILDALVDAHLHDFDVSEDLSLRWEPALLPAPGQSQPAIGFTAALLLKK